MGAACFSASKQSLSPRPFYPLKASEGANVSYSSVALTAPNTPEAVVLPASAQRVSLPKHMSMGREERLLSCPDHHHHTESAIARKLVSLFEIQDPAVASTDALLHKFDARRPPKISLDEYIKRMVHYLTNIAFTERKTHHDDHVHSDLACRYLITARMLVGRVQQTKGLVLTPLNVHRFIIVGLLLASKILDDLDIGVAFFALLGGVDAAELVTLESVFLDLVAYNLAVDERDFRRIYQSVLGQGDRMMSEDALDHCSIYSPLLEHDGVPPSIANEV